MTPLFPTYVVGSLPRDEWVVDVINSRNAGELGAEDADRLLDGAVLNAVRMQEAAGLDYVSDGEWRRNSYTRVFTDAVDGFTRDLQPPRKYATAGQPAVTSRIVQREPLSTEDAAFLQANATAGTIATLPSPYSVGATAWTAEHSATLYPSRAETMEACAPIINGAVKELADIGVDVVQLDDTWLGDLPNPDFRAEEGIHDLEEELDLYVRSINVGFEGVEGVSLSVHVCGHTSPATQGSDGWPYELLFEALGRMNAERFTIAMAGPNLDGYGALRDFPKDAVLGLGVLRTIDQRIETPQEIVQRVERALEFVPKERVALNPDCGFSPSTRNRRDIDGVYLRLKAMCEAAETLRDKYG